MISKYISNIHGYVRFLLLFFQSIFALYRCTHYEELTLSSNMLRGTETTWDDEIEDIFLKLAENNKQDSLKP